MLTKAPHKIKITPNLAYSAVHAPEQSQERLSTTSKAHQASGRYIAVDIVRGYAMLAMLVSHSVLELENTRFYRLAYHWTEPHPSYLDSLDKWIGLILHIASPTFFLLAGFSLLFLSPHATVAGGQKARSTASC